MTASAATVPNSDEPEQESLEVPSRELGSFREEWPFLSNPSCPMELKVLASDKITAYHNYRSLHEKLFDCTDTVSAFETAKNLLENYRQNRLILAEFAFYKEHHRILGKHPVFKERKQLDQYRRMSAVQLYKEQQRLLGAIWRVKSEMAKGDKPHLLSERSARLASKQRELAAVEELMSDFEKKS